MFKGAAAPGKAAGKAAAIRPLVVPRPVILPGARERSRTPIPAQHQRSAPTTPPEKLEEAHEARDLLPGALVEAMFFKGYSPEEAGRIFFECIKICRQAEKGKGKGKLFMGNLGKGAGPAALAAKGLPLLQVPPPQEAAALDAAAAPDAADAAAGAGAVDASDDDEEKPPDGELCDWREDKTTPRFARSGTKKNTKATSTTTGSANRATPSR